MSICSIIVSWLVTNYYRLQYPCHIRYWSVRYCTRHSG